MKELWKEIIESFELRIMALILLSTFILFLLAFLLVKTFSDKKAQQSQEVIAIDYPYIKQIKRNFNC